MRGNILDQQECPQTRQQVPLLQVVEWLTQQLSLRATSGTPGGGLIEYFRPLDLMQACVITSFKLVV
jgi:hypothetical protein